MSSIAIILVTSSGDLNSDYEAHLLDATNNAITANLPDFAADGDSYLLSRVDTSLNGVTVVAPSGKTINNSSSVAMLPGNKFRVISYGTNYYLF
ncbi:MAG TPA: hypothetical protein VLG50_07955 [Candidatus Saccharimonadales bacterium]|nr:hypothetical protein [Candidatus Saccharimonadales bacterium]